MARSQAASGAVEAILMEPLGARTLEDLARMVITKPRNLIEDLLPIPGAVVMVGTQKAGKTVLAAQMAMSVAAGVPLFDEYAVCEPGPALFLEQDDPAGEATLKELSEHTRIPMQGKPFQYIANCSFALGPEFFLRLEAEILRSRTKLCILDSYTALRSGRPNGVDICEGGGNGLWRAGPNRQTNGLHHCDPASCVARPGRAGLVR